MRRNVAAGRAGGHWGRRALGLALSLGALLFVAAPAHAFNFTIAADNTTLAEGGSAKITVTPTCGLLDSGNETVTITLLNGTATGGKDFESTSTPGSVSIGCVSVLPTAGSVMVNTTDDALNESDETFTVQATSGTETHSTELTITDDDPLPKLSIAAASGKEGTSLATPPETAPLNVPVTLSAASGRDITLSYHSDPGTADSSDGPNIGKTGQITIPAGQTAANIPIAITEDTLDELDETFTVTLNDPPATGATYALKSSPQTATATITNDDVPQVGVASFKGVEGTGGGTTFTFNVALTNPSTRSISVDYKTLDIASLPAAIQATANTDYGPVAGTITFAPGETVKPVNVAITPDGAVEGNASYRGEAFAFQLSNPNPALSLIDVGLGAGIAWGFIDDDDTATPGTGTGTGTTPGTGTGTGTLPIGGGSGGTDVTPPKITVSKIKFKKPKTLSVTISCPTNETSCRGTLSIFSKKVPKSKVKALHKELTLGSKVFVLPGGTSGTITLTLNKKNAAAVKAGKRVKVSATAVARDAAGNAAVKTVAGTLVS